MCPRVGTAYTCPIPNVDKYWKYNALDKDSGIEISINRYQFEKLPYNITFDEPRPALQSARILMTYMRSKLAIP